MKQVAKFEKVSFEQFKKDIESCFKDWYKTEDDIREIYEKLELPSRATKGSAGYDFKCPINFILHKDKPTIIPTGIKVKIDEGWVLNMYPRSGLGFKYGFKLLNTVGIIDSDYYYSSNEGHIMTKVCHTDGEYMLKVNQGDRFMQGVFTEYGIIKNDKAEGIRYGGLGSTEQ